MLTMGITIQRGVCIYFVFILVMNLFTINVFVKKYAIYNRKYGGFENIYNTLTNRQYGLLCFFRFDFFVWEFILEMKAVADKMNGDNLTVCGLFSEKTACVVRTTMYENRSAI